MLAEAAVEDFLRGINATIFAYGQTGTGKTYSMYGSEQVLRDLSRAPPETYGSALKAVLRILAHLSSRPAARLQLAYLEVYNDTINDLLPRSDGQGRAAGHDLRLRESASEGVYVEGLQYCEVSSPQQVFTAIAAGNQARHVAGTNVNSRSSRSHTMLVLTLAQPEVPWLGLGLGLG